VCGIIGYVGSRTAKELLLQGLERLEYRGYDSAGICLIEESGLDHVRAVGNLDQLKEAAGHNGSASTTGVGHTRWATHGKVSYENAHPLTGCSDEEIGVVLNGIVENFRELRDGLAADGHAFTSETDAEVVAHLVERHYEGDLVEAVRATYEELEGHFAFVVIHRDHPGTLVGARLQCPLVVGVGQGEMFLASSIAAFLRETRRVQLIEAARSSRSGRRACSSSPFPAAVSATATRWRSTGTTRLPRSRATRPSCSRRSTSSRRRSPTRSASALGATASSWRRSG
jgi:glucosamine--fructose-6-phosphate aminotransferase (isomerizing)